MKTKTVLFLTPLLILLLAAPVRADWVLNERGELVYVAYGQVLGDDDREEDDSSNSGSGSSGSDSDSSDSDHDDEGGDEDDHDTTEDPTHDDSDEEDHEDEFRFESEYIDPTTGAKIKTEVRGDETKTEIEFADGSEIHSETRGDESQLEAKSGDSKLKLEQRDDRLIIKTEGSQLESHNSFTIRAHADDDEVNVSTGSGKTMVITKGKARARTSLPISVDTLTNLLSVTTAAGSKTVTILPNEAVANMLAANVIDHVSSDDLFGGAEDETEDTIDLVEFEDELVYEIDGVSEQNLLGFVPLELARQVRVSAETGEILGVDMSLANRLLDLISF